ncbi:hypothetical protein JCM8208_004632 [Rhodotorula glutinis]
MDNKILDDPTSSSSSPTCHLLRLPDELLDAVFRTVHFLPYHRRYSSWPAPLNSPLSRRLYRVQQPALYRHIIIDRYANLQSLCDTVRDTPGVGAHVEELVLNLEDDQPEVDYDEDEDDERERPAVDWQETSWTNLYDNHVVAVEPATFFRLLEHLPRLKILRIKHLDGRLLDVIVSPARASTVDWVAHLAHYASLETLNLAQTRRGPPLPSVSTSVPVLKSLKVLHLSGESVGWSICPPLGEFAPHLVELYLDDETWDELDFLPALRTAPVGLRRLHLGSGRSALVRPDTFVVDDLLPRFFGLEDLTLGAGTFTSPGLLRALLDLPSLHILAFGHGAPVPDILLEHLVAGPLRPPSLRRIILGHVSCGRDRPVGRTTLHPFPSQDGRRPPKFRMALRWRAPRWPSGATEAGLAAMVETARASGIQVDGRAVECVGWEADFACEKRSALLLWGERTGDYVEARRELGHELVEEHLEGLRASAQAAKAATNSVANDYPPDFATWVTLALK